ncbi:translation initiation factor IF-2 [Firmicutes bacterium CAG:449]|nr:translation initiation factor IF-2 [Firmicutes bacterium CAG:449]
MAINNKKYPAKKGKNENNRVSNVPHFDKNKKSNTPQNKVKGGVFKYTGDVTVGELAKQLELNSSDIIKFLFMTKKAMVTINQTLSDDLIAEVCINYGFDFHGFDFQKEEIVNKENFEDLKIVDDEKDLVERPPVVVVMGHVDHGKTTLIDTIRDSHVADGEAGLITQQIGAYQKEIQGKKITFLDTPGHEAFTAMRARGAAITDIALIVVAADDGVMPQTVEAINHAKAAGVTIIVVINKIDKPTANVDRVKDELAQYDLIPEEWGGDTIFKEVSAKKKIGIDELLETILVVAELKELKANPHRYALGSVIEASLDRNEGPKATLLVQNGTLKIGDSVVIGNYYCKVRRMVNEYRQNILSALPSTPVVVTGIEDVPTAGDSFMAFADEKTAREIADARKLKARNKSLNKSSAASLADLFNQIHEGEIKNINVVLRADLQGSVEAVKASLEKIQVEGVKVNVIHAAAGAITESDIVLAAASNALVYGFNVRPDAKVRQKAEEEHVEIHLHSIIYALIEEIENAMKGLMKPVEEEVVIGQAEVRSIFKASKVGTIAGCYVTEGCIKRDSMIRLIRDGVVIYTGKISSLKRFKDDASVVKKDFECGLTIENYNDEKEFDIIEAYEMQVVERK